MSKNRNGRQPPALDVSWDYPAEAADGSFSLALRVSITGHWPAGRPDTVAITVSELGRQLLNELLDLQNGESQIPVSGLVAGHHYSLLVSTGGREVRRLIEVPKQKTREEKKLARTRIKLDQANVDIDLRNAKKKLDPPKLQPTSIQLKKNEGVTGEYTIVVTVLAEDASGAKVGVPEIPITIFDGPGRYAAKTGSSGVYTFSSKVADTGAEKNLTVSVDGTEISKTIKLLGRPSP